MKSIGGVSFVCIISIPGVWRYGLYLALDERILIFCLHAHGDAKI